MRARAFLIALLALSPGCNRDDAPDPILHGPPAARFGEGGRALERTAVLATLETPIPEGKSAVWCASLALAWKELEKLAGGPVALQGGGEEVERLNRDRASLENLPEGAAYARAGFARDGIVETIRREMGERFPGHPLPDLAIPPDGGVAYAYLKAGMSFRNRFPEAPGPIPFTSIDGSRTPVQGFGILPGNREDPEVLFRLREQVRILHHRGEGNFAVDLDGESAPNQVILACMERKRTLGEALRALEEVKAVPDRLGERDTLFVPSMSFRIDQRFQELERMHFINEPLQGLSLLRAHQVIDLRLSRSGVQVKSEAQLVGGARPFAVHLRFDRPFLLVLKKRGASRPFLVLWIENPELLLSVKTA